MTIKLRKGDPLLYEYRVLDYKKDPVNIQNKQVYVRISIKQQYIIIPLKEYSVDTSDAHSILGWIKVNIPVEDLPQDLQVGVYLFEVYLEGILLDPESLRVFPESWENDCKPCEQTIYPDYNKHDCLVISDPCAIEDIEEVEENFVFTSKPYPFNTIYEGLITRMVRATSGSLRDGTSVVPDFYEETVITNPVLALNGIIKATQIEVRAVRETVQYSEVLVNSGRLSGDANYIPSVAEELFSESCFISSGESVTEWTPESLYKDGRAGVWFAPSDDRTCFQDVAGTTPALADGDPVALIVNKAKEKDWVKVNTVDSVDGAVSPSAITRYAVTNELTVGSRYLVSADVIGYSGNNDVGIAAGPLGGSSVTTPSRLTSNGKVIAYLACTASGVLELFTRPSNTCNFRNIQVWEIPLDNSDLAYEGTATNRGQLKVDGSRRFIRGGQNSLNFRAGFIPPEYTTDRISVGIAMQRPTITVWTAWRSSADRLGYAVGLGHTEAGAAIIPSSLVGNKFLLNGEDQGTVGTRVAMINGGNPYVGILQGTRAIYPGADTPVIRILGYSTTTLAGNNDLFEYLEVEGEDFGVHWSTVDNYLRLSYED